MWKAAVFMIWVGFGAQAQAIKVTSGEHPDFSRLVLTLPTPTEWKLGRTANGYELALAAEQMRFDVSTVFDLIPKSRLSGIFADPVTGNLQMTVGCPCYVVAFSLNAQTIVIDLRNGPAPENSSFESGLDGRIWPALQLATDTIARPISRSSGNGAVPTYNWLTATPAPEPMSVPLPVAQSQDAGSAIRETLVAQLAAGAARSVIELALPENRPLKDKAPFLPDDVPLRITSSVGLQIGVDRPIMDQMQPDGMACLPDDQLDVSGWVIPDKANAPYSGLFSDLVGEFDQPRKAEIIAAAKQYIYLGFGVEARALLLAFDGIASPDDPLFDLARLVDGTSVVGANAFSGMESCDTAAALWALLANDLAMSAQVNMSAVKRAFSALPAHLRTNIGPVLIEILLRRSDDDVAIEIREAMDRGTKGDTRAVALATSEILIATGDADQAVTQLQDVLADPGVMQAQAMVKLVSAQTAAGDVVAPETVTVIEALLEEYEGNALYPELRQAYARALAGAGQFNRAVDFSQQGQPLDPVFWRVLAERGSDDDLLLHTGTPVPADVPQEATAQIADRLQNLGFVTEAAFWRATLPSGDAPMQAESARQEGLDPPDTVRAARWNGDWQTVAGTDDGVWQDLANRLGAQTQQPVGSTLASANEALAQSQMSRDLIGTLLEETTQAPVTP